MSLQGRSLIGFQTGSTQGIPFQGINPATGEALPVSYGPASAGELERAVSLAAQAFPIYERLGGKVRGAFLRSIAQQIEQAANDIKNRATAETGLAEARLSGEIARTTAQLRLFAALVEEGSWVDARIDTALPDRQPLPKPDIRSMLRGIGPVAVFGASNFPLAFSVAGGDTASALAAGNPVVVKAHPAHPGTSELVGQAVLRAVKECGLPEGTFSLLYGGPLDVGQPLARHPAIKAIGFTGSRRAGRALHDIAALRPEPIPVFAEMSSINPVFLLPGALAERAMPLAEGLHASLNLGAGQFCTNPGLVVYEEKAAAGDFKKLFSERIQGTAPAVMLHHGIRQAYLEGIARKETHPGVRSLAAGKDTGTNTVVPAVFETDAATFLSDPSLSEEVFGPSAIFVKSPGREELLQIAASLEGHLTATVFGTESELAEYADLIQILQRKVGRLIFNQFPTGVEVGPAMVHGGPYPATTDGRSTSVGTAAILRFARPLCYQNFPERELPEELKNSNPLDIWRLVDGRRERGPIPASA